MRRDAELCLTENHRDGRQSLEMTRKSLAGVAARASLEHIQPESRLLRTDRDLA